MNEESMLGKVKLAYHRTTCLNNCVCINYKEEKAENNNNLITPLVGIISMHCCDATKAEKISLLIAKMMTKDHSQ